MLPFSFLRALGPPSPTSNSEDLLPSSQALTVKVLTPPPPSPTPHQGKDALLSRALILEPRE